MHLKSPTPMQVIKKEEKEAKLSRFITDSINEPCINADNNTVKHCFIVARSQLSPVAQAAAACADEMTIAGYVIHVIFASDDATDTEDALDSASILAANGCCRIIKDQRLFDAHEQFVLSDKGAWIGDSMRRDPLKIDAYECYAGNDSDVAKWAASAFEKLWSTTAEMRIKPALIAADTTNTDILLPLNADESESDKPSVGTRH